MLFRSLLKGRDLFVGVSAPNLLSAKMVASMAPDPVIFALANPTPEIDPLLAHAGGAAIIGTGRSDFPNQINNVLVFPGLMKGLLEARAKTVTEGMKLAACKALAGMIPVPELRADHILPGIFDDRVVDIVKNAVIAEVK